MPSSWCTFVIVILAFCFFNSWSRAETTREVRSVIVYVPSGRGNALRDEIVGALTSTTRVTRSGLAKALGSAGIGSLERVLASPRGPERVTQVVMGLLEQTKTDAAVIALPEPGRPHERPVRVLVFIAGDSSPRADETVLTPLRSTISDRQKQWGEVLDELLIPTVDNSSKGARSALSPPSASAPAGPERRESAVPTERSNATVTHSSEPAASSLEPGPPSRSAGLPGPPSRSTGSAEWLAVGTDFAWGMRTYTHTESTQGHAVRRYGAYGVPGLSAILELHPLVLLRGGGIARDLGIVAHFSTSFGFSSGAPGSLPAAQTPPLRATHWYTLDAALRWRLPLSQATLGAALGYGTSIFDFDLGDLTDRETPRGRYGMVRAGVDAQLRIVGPISLKGSLSYLHVVSIGSLSTYAPVGASASPIQPAGVGLEGVFGATCQVLPMLAIWLGGRYLGIFYQADTSPTPTGKPNSVADQYFWLSTGVRLVL